MMKMLISNIREVIGITIKRLLVQGLNGNNVNEN